MYLKCNLICLFESDFFNNLADLQIPNLLAHVSVIGNDSCLHHTHTHSSNKNHFHFIFTQKPCSALAFCSTFKPTNHPSISPAPELATFWLPKRHPPRSSYFCLSGSMNDVDYHPQRSSSARKLHAKIAGISSVPSSELHKRVFRLSFASHDMHLPHIYTVSMVGGRVDCMLGGGCSVCFWR